MWHYWDLPQYADVKTPIQVRRTPLKNWWRISLMTWDRSGSILLHSTTTRGLTSHCMTSLTYLRLSLVNNPAPPSFHYWSYRDENVFLHINLVSNDCLKWRTQKYTSYSQHVGPIISDFFFQKMKRQVTGFHFLVDQVHIVQIKLSFKMIQYCGFLPPNLGSKTQYFLVKSYFIDFCHVHWAIIPSCSFCENRAVFHKVHGGVNPNFFETHRVL